MNQHLKTLLLWMVFAVSPLFAATTITDTLIDPGTSSAFTGTMYARLNHSITIGSVQYSEAVSSFTIVSGALSVQLAPNDQGVPAGSSYSVQFVSSSDTWLEQWFVYNSSTPLTLSNVRTGTAGIVLTTTGSSGAATLSAGTLNIPHYGSGSGTVSTFSGSGPSWLTWTVANPTTTPAASLAPTTGQSSHQVIGTCNAATTFGPCALVAGDLPTIPNSGLMNPSITVGGATCTLGSSCTPIQGAVATPTFVATAQSTSSATLVDLGTADSVTFTCATICNVVVQYSANEYCTTNTGNPINAVFIDGTQVDDGNQNILIPTGNNPVTAGAGWVAASLSAASHTVDVKHASGGGAITCYWRDRLTTVSYTP